MSKATETRMTLDDAREAILDLIAFIDDDEQWWAERGEGLLDGWEMTPDELRLELIERARQAQAML